MDRAQTREEENVGTKWDDVKDLPENICIQGFLRYEKEENLEDCYLMVLDSIVDSTLRRKTLDGEFIEPDSDEGSSGANNREYFDVFDRKTVQNILKMQSLQISLLNNKLKKHICEMLTTTKATTSISDMKRKSTQIYNEIEKACEKAYANYSEFKRFMITRRTADLKEYKELSLRYQRIRIFISEKMPKILFQRLEKFKKISSDYIAVEKYENTLESMYQNSRILPIDRGMKLLTEETDEMDRHLENIARKLSFLNPNNLTKTEETDLIILLSMHKHWNKIVEIEKTLAKCLNTKALDELFIMSNPQIEPSKNTIRNIIQRVLKSTNFQCFTNRKTLKNMLKYFGEKTEPRVHKTLKNRMCIFLIKIVSFVKVAKHEKVMLLLNKLEKEKDDFYTQIERSTKKYRNAMWTRLQIVFEFLSNLWKKLCNWVFRFLLFLFGITENYFLLISSTIFIIKTAALGYKCYRGIKYFFINSSNKLSKNIENMNLPKNTVGKHLHTHTNKTIEKTVIYFNYYVKNSAKHLFTKASQILAIICNIFNYSWFTWSGLLHMGLF